MEQRLPLEIINYRHVNGKTNGKSYTIVEGVVRLGPAQQSICEAFLEGTHHFQPGRYELVLSLGVNQQKRIEARVLRVEPIQQQKAA